MGATLELEELKQSEEGTVHPQGGTVQPLEGTVQTHEETVQLQEGTAHLQDGTMQPQEGIVQPLEGTVQLQEKTVHPQEAVAMDVAEPSEEVEVDQQADKSIVEESTPSGRISLKQGISLPLIGTVLWRDVWTAACAWLSDPMNLALLAWIVAVAVAGGILFLTMTGMLNNVIPNQDTRKVWGEACNQVLTALFTLYVLLVQPWRIIYAIWLCRWKGRDQRRLRTVFSRSGPDVAIPREKLHLGVVVVLLNLNCLFQYCLAGVMWGIKMDSRSGILVGLLLACAIGSVACAGLYCLFSPLGRPQPEAPRVVVGSSLVDGTHTSSRSTGTGEGDEAQAQEHALQETSQGEALSFAESSGRSRESDFSRKPASGAALIAPSASDMYTTSIPLDKDMDWGGHLLECWRSPRTFWTVLFCCCCAFGHNLKRAGFGSQYLHAVMLILFLITPFLVCEFAAMQVADKRLASALIAAGVVLSYLGLLYGGYWRYHLATVFRLPKVKFCGSDRCGPAGDCMLWLLCCSCALCQEIRTVKEHGLHVKFHQDTSCQSSSDEVEEKPSSGATGDVENTQVSQDQTLAPTEQAMVINVEK